VALSEQQTTPYCITRCWCPSHY